MKLGICSEEETSYKKPGPNCAVDKTTHCLVKDSDNIYCSL